MGNGTWRWDQRGVTPVVGIILLVAIAIVMAAVLGQHVFGLDLIQSPGAAPQISFSTDYDRAAERLNLTHESGSNLAVNETTVVVSQGNGDGNWVNKDALGEEVTSGEAIRLTDIQPEEIVRIIWTNPTTDESYVVLTWEGPDADV